LATFKLGILACRTEISYGQILYLESFILDEVKNKIWPYEISVQQAKISSLNVVKLGKLLYLIWLLQNAQRNRIS
jgi:hypothetical protein